MQSKKIISKDLIKHIWIASRPLSLTLALYSTTLGIVIAYLRGELFSGNLQYDLWLIFLVTVAGLIVQTGTNFINDYFECEYKHRNYQGKRYQFLGKKRPPLDILIFLLGIACFMITGLLGLYLVYLTSSRLMIIGVIGIIGGYSYTGEPIVYKKRGLGTPLSFILMGPLMVYGSYLVFSQHFSWQPVLLSLPVSFMIPLLMLSNELRDYQRDKKLNIRTLTVRLGYDWGKRLYLSLLLGSYLLTGLLIVKDMLPLSTLSVFLTIPLAVRSYRTVSKSEKKGVPITNKLHLSFGLITILTIIIG